MANYENKGGLTAFGAAGPVAKVLDSTTRKLTGAENEGDDSHSQIAARQAALRALREDEVPIVVAGAYAVREYTGIYRDTKDLDVFCLRADAERALESLARIGFRTEMTDPLWLAKGFADDGEFVDVIFSSGNGVAEVDELWFTRSRAAKVLGVPSLIAPVEEIIWSKAFVQERERYDGADVHHLIRFCADFIDWNHLLMRFEPHEEVLLAHLVNYRFAFPGEREKVPRWVLEALIPAMLAEGPVGREKVCRGTLLSRCQYAVDLALGLADARPLEVPAWRAHKMGIDS